MCGIAGVFSPAGVDGEIVRRMVKRLVHRGPDSEGFWSGPAYSAGMRRLSIMDVAGGDQPLFDESGKVVLFYNGEIYNYHKLRRDLEAEGVQFRSHSDGEVICHLYRKHGRALFELLDGMFAVALWDSEQQLLLLARDFPGEKPLYYSKLPRGGIAFASEIPALVQHPNISREFDFQALWDYPTFLWVPEPATIYQNIRAILPGEGLEVSAKGLRPFSFKELIARSSGAVATDAEAIEMTRAIVSKAVQSRLRSDVPVGAFLSGGLDSSIVCSLASRQLDQLSTFCIGFEDVDDPYHGRSDESAAAEAFARTLGTKHTTVRMSSTDLRELLPTFVRAAGQPFAVSSGLGILAVARAARECGIKVLLSGDGADEAFGGYSWYPSIPASFRAQGSQPGEVFRFIDRIGSLENRIDMVARYSPRLRAWAWHYYASEDEKAALFHPEIRAQNSLHCFDDSSFGEPIDYVRHDRLFYFPNEMLTKLDRMTMAFSVEGRAPFAAPAVQHHAQRLGWGKLIRDNNLKWVLREAFKPYLPADVYERPKHGFNVPIDYWLQGEWRDLLQDTFAADSSLCRSGFLRQEAASNALRLVDDPQKVAGHVLLSFVLLNLWMECQ